MAREGVAMQCIHSDGQATQLLSDERALVTVCGVVFRAGMSKAIQSHLIEHPLICWSPSCWCVLCSRTHLYAPVTTRLFACKRGTLFRTFLFCRQDRIQQTSPTHGPGHCVVQRASDQQGLSRYAALLIPFRVVYCCRISATMTRAIRMVMGMGMVVAPLLILTTVAMVLLHVAIPTGKYLSVRSLLAARSLGAA